jgi:hypothetical protein
VSSERGVGTVLPPAVVGGVWDKARAPAADEGFNPAFDNIAPKARRTGPDVAGTTASAGLDMSASKQVLSIIQEKRCLPLTVMTHSMACRYDTPAIQEIRAELIPNTFSTG